jgi:hypothetical protein
MDVVKFQPATAGDPAGCRYRHGESQSAADAMAEPQSKYHRAVRLTPDIATDLIVITIWCLMAATMDTRYL